MATPVFIGLGSNLGDRRGILEAAITSLAEVPGVAVRAVSSFHETKLIGGPPGQGPFLNAAAYLETSLDPYQLLAALQEIENQAGRVRVVRWGERTLDLDILIFGTKFLDSKELKLPHPRLAFRPFVLAPLAEIAPLVVETMTKRTVAELLANLDRKPRYLAIHGKQGRRKSAVFQGLVDQLPGFGISEDDLRDDNNQVDLESTSFLKTLEAKAVALRESFWEGENLRVPWIVTDYCLEFDLLSFSSLSFWKERYPIDFKARMMANREGMQRVRGLVKSCLSPTFVLIVRPQFPRDRRPGASPLPSLWPESHNPGTIIAEVLATCRGIESI